MNGPTPAWAYERPEVHPHDPRWAVRARVESERLTELLGPWLVDGVEHIGSTAVAGLAAKPIIDLMASVGDLNLVVDQASELLAADGWCLIPPELDCRPWRRFFVKPDASKRRRKAHLHLVRAGDPQWAEMVRFRDALRRDGQLAQRYVELKRRLAQQHGDDREAYTAGKTEFVENVLRRLSIPELDDRQGSRLRF
ncbi:MAG TPA: GrpB family protein [Actinophytocola sp.]|uniref:GrpB family protein n=1 Tax=Actinophytocola sp. TaxID=1872138 RepID=UPI002DDCE53C|nr:GrpB family protein [Actinophytocola sp.]HEV2780907.1 GrpB family protein [Actinophytocola sp.]